MAHEYRPTPMSLAQRAALRKQEPRTLRRPARRRVLPLLLVLLLLAIIVLGAGAFEYYYRDRILPRVTIPAAGLDLSGLTQIDAANRLHPYSIEQQLRTIALIAPGSRQAHLSAFALGYRIDGGATVTAAYAVGRDGSLWQRFKAQVRTLYQATNVPVSQYVSSSVLRRQLLGLAPRVNTRPRPGVAGRILNVERAIPEIARELLRVRGGFKVDLPFAVVPALPRPAVHHAHKPTKRRAKH